MNAGTFERYLDRGSAIHDLDPRVKVLVVPAFVLSVALLPQGAWGATIAAFGLVMAAALAARISPLWVIRRSLIGLPFLLAATTLPFTVPGRAVWVGPWGLAISDEGVLRLTVIVARSLISLQAALLLTATTRFPDILHAMRHLKVPAALVSIIGFMYRYLFVLADEAERLLRARTARSGRLPGVTGGGTVVWRARVTGRMAGQLLLRSLDRSERVYQAMLARGYRGEMLTMTPHVMRPGDWAALAVGLVAIVGLHGVG